MRRSFAKIIAIALLALPGLVLAQKGAIDAKTFEALTKAQELAEQGETAQALATLDKLKGSDKLNSYAKSQMWNFYAFIYASNNQYKEAIGAYRKVLSQRDATEGLKSNAKYTIAQMYFQIEDYSNCIRFMQSWLSEVDKPTPTAHIMLAQAYYQTEQYDRALSNVNTAIDLEQAEGKPINESWLRLKSALYFSKKDYKATAETYEQLIALYPKLSYMRQLAGIYSELGENKKRLAVYDAIYEHGGLSKETELLNLAYMYLGQDVPYKAGTIIETGMQAGVIEDNQKNITTLANAWAAANEHKKAVPALERAAQQSDDGVLFARLAGVHFNAGDFDEAVKAAKLADQKGGLKNPANNLMLMGMAQFNTKQFEGALQSFRRAKQDKSSFRAAAKWESYTTAELKRIRALEKAKLELEKRTEEALEADENNQDAIDISG
ncbi:tetratricopeptide repeat protein [bacterium]|nr:tetratricopeptide repeat protein [bacterium]